MYEDFSLHSIGWTFTNTCIIYIIYIYIIYDTGKKTKLLLKNHEYINILQKNVALLHVFKL